MTGCDHFTSLLVFPDQDRGGNIRLGVGLFVPFAMFLKNVYAFHH